MILRCAIVDDEPLALGLLESYVNKTPFLQLTGKYSSAVQAMKELPGEEVDLLFLDIQMPELNGLEFSQMVDSRTRIVFTTAFGQYAIDGYRVNADSTVWTCKALAEVNLVSIHGVHHKTPLRKIQNRFNGICKPLLNALLYNQTVYNNLNIMFNIFVQLNLFA